MFSIINFEKVKTARKCIRDSRRFVGILWRELDFSIVIPTLANQVGKKKNQIAISDSFFQSLHELDKNSHKLSWGKLANLQKVFLHSLPAHNLKQ